MFSDSFAEQRSVGELLVGFISLMLVLATLSKYIFIICRVFYGIFLSRGRKIHCFVTIKIVAATDFALENGRNCHRINWDARTSRSRVVLDFFATTSYVGLSIPRVCMYEGRMNFGFF